MSEIHENISESNVHENKISVQMIVEQNLHPKHEEVITIQQNTKLVNDESALPTASAEYTLKPLKSFIPISSMPTSRNRTALESDNN
ncbi:MAG: hypothetical protein RLZ12_916 [Bacillota bacterium]